MFRLKELPNKIECRDCSTLFSKRQLDEERLVYEQLVCNKCDKKNTKHLEENREQLETSIHSFFNKPIIKSIVNK